MKYFTAFLFLVFTAQHLAYGQSANEAKHIGRYVKIETNLGAMFFQLSELTPKHTANFIKLAKKGYFDRYDFNRIIKGFVAQGGETDSAYAAMEKQGKVLERLDPEFNPVLFHQRGALAAVRDDNPSKASFLGQIYLADGKKYTDAQLDAYEKRGGFQFTAEARKLYKEVGGTPSLDQKYTVFGQLVKGWEVFDALMGVKINKTDRPLTLINMKVKVLTKKEVSALKLPRRF